MGTATPEDLLFDAVTDWQAQRNEYNIASDSEVGARLAGYLEEPLVDILLRKGIPPDVIAECMVKAANAPSDPTTQAHDVYDLPDTCRVSLADRSEQGQEL